MNDYRLEVELERELWDQLFARALRERRSEGAIVRGILRRTFGLSFDFEDPTEEADDPSEETPDTDTTEDATEEE